MSQIKKVGKPDKNMTLEELWEYAGLRVKRIVATTCPYGDLDQHLAGTANCELGDECVYSPKPLGKSMRDSTSIVRSAIANTTADYWIELCSMRAGRGESAKRMGSFYPRLTGPQVERLIRTLVWEPYTHSEVKEPAMAFIARHAPGVVGVAQLADVPEDAELVWDDTKNTGNVELIWKGAPDSAHTKVDYTVAIVGPHDGKEIVYTFHPGDPVKPSQVDRHWGGLKQLHSSDRHQKKVSKKDAAALGVRWVKLS